MDNKKHWLGYEELANEAEMQKRRQNEFLEELPVLSELNGIAIEQNATRRDFLKVLGFSVSAAAIAASCEIPVKKAIPYVVKPEEIIPGIANHYASTFLNGSDYCSVLVKTREGRPIKVDGNDMGITKGGTSARAQASILSLYDGARLRQPKKGRKKTTWDVIDKEIAEALASAGEIAIISSAIASPSTKKAIQDFSKRYTRTRHVAYEPISNAGMVLANEASFGKKAIPSYDFGKADVIVSLGADFLGTWISPVEFAAQYAPKRKVSKGHAKMSKHWQFESYMSLTGANADKRLTIKPSQEGLVALALLKKLGGGVSAPALGNAKLEAAIDKAANDLSHAKGKALVVSGSNDPNVQTIVNAINDKIGSYGSTINWDAAYNLHVSDDAEMDKLVADMEGGRIGAVILYGVNPAYNYRDSAKFIAGLKNTKTSISFNVFEDESSKYITYLCPDNHYLESWNDVEPKAGHYSLMQPTIAPLFDTRQAQESLLKWAGVENPSFYDYMRQQWGQMLSGDEAWNKALHDGVYISGGASMSSGIASVAPDGGHEQVADTTTHDEHVALAASGFSGGVSQAASAITSAAGSAQGVELKLFESIGIGNGDYAGNPFLQETPDPITKVTWENVLMVSKKYAEEQGWGEYDIIKVEANGHSMELPVVYQPGQAYGTAALALGYGRTKVANQAFAVGANAFPMVKSNGKTFDYNVLSGVTLSKSGGRSNVARTQMHHVLYDTGVGDNHRHIIGETTLEEFKADPYAGNKPREHFDNNKEHLFFTLYGKDDEFGPHADKFRQGHHWGLAIDLNTCIGCSACVVACNVENNVPVVGRDEVFRAREMHWMRIDRYFSGELNADGELENPDVAFMPMMCQQCDNAPCENVCPVAATNHSSEGINQMAYNRCIGTRYCANNCPYKVRRFNWFDYQGADSFYAGTLFDNDEYIIVDDLTRMVLNPDVTVRSRGVMEKCSFCIQRIQEGKLTAKKGGRRLKDGDIVMACQQSCPTNAIVFGDLNDKKSEVSQLTEMERSYHLLEEIHVLPTVAYMTKVRNRKPAPGTVKPGGHDKHDKKDDGHGGHDDHGHG